MQFADIALAKDLRKRCRVLAISFEGNPGRHVWAGHQKNDEERRPLRIATKLHTMLQESLPGGKVEFAKRDSSISINGDRCAYANRAGKVIWTRFADRHASAEVQNDCSGFAEN